MNFNTWLDTFIEEKRIDPEQILEVEGASGTNMIPIKCLVKRIKAASSVDRKYIQRALINLDFANAPIVPFFKHLAEAVAI